MKLSRYIVVLALILSLIFLFGCQQLPNLPRSPGSTPVLNPTSPQPSASTSPGPSNTTITSPIPTQVITPTPANTQTPSPIPTHSQAPLTISFVDVGQADCTIIQYGSSSMIIDAGGNATASSLVSEIKNWGISKFDVVVGTHPHEDHIGGLDAVISSFEIGNIFMPKVSNNTQTFMDVLEAIQNKGLSVTTPVPGDAFTLGNDVQCTILAPNSPSYQDLNSHSIVLKMVYGSTSFLFTGDAETDSEQEMLAKGFNLDSDVLKVGHHASSSSTSTAFLNAVSPDYGVIFVGKDNIYGHPHQEILDKLNAAGVQVYRTDLNGTIKMVSNGSTIIVLPQHLITSTPIPTPASTMVASTSPSPSVIAPILTPTPTPTPTLPDSTSTPTEVSADIQITNIFYDGLVPSVEYDEYVEIANLGSTAVNMNGWILKDVADGTPSFRFPSYSLQPGTSIRVYTNEVHPEYGGFSFGYGKAIWNNSDPDIAGLFNAQGQEISRKSY